MPIIEVIKGDKFGMLSIVEEVSPLITPKGAKVRQVRCKCDCGSTKIAILSNLRSGYTKSCGCYQREKTIKANMTILPPYDNKYGRLTIIKEVEGRSRTSGRKRRFALCQCECGKQKEINLFSVVSGRTQSCGCSMKFVKERKNGILCEYRGETMTLMQICIKEGVDYRNVYYRIRHAEMSVTDAVEFYKRRNNASKRKRNN